MHTGSVIRFYILAAFLASAVAFAIPGYCDERGPAFSDPSVVAPIDEEWVKEPVEHASWAKGADVVITLDQHMFPALLPLIDDFERETGLKVYVSLGTCGISSGMLMRKEADIAGLCCPPAEFDRLPEVEFHTLGIGSLALLVHPSSPVKSVTLKEARDLFAGRIYNWSELGGRGGPKRPVQPVARLHCKTRPGHWRLLIDNEDLFSPRLREVGTIKEMISFVANNEDAIGYESIWMLEQYKGEGMARPLIIDGVLPSDDKAFLERRYPLYRVYSITSWGGKNRSKDADKLIEYLLKHLDDLDPKCDLIPPARLREAGWKFRGDELVGEPD
jgi:hypothetical protein